MASRFDSKKQALKERSRISAEYKGMAAKLRSKNNSVAASAASASNKNLNTRMKRVERLFSSGTEVSKTKIAAERLANKVIDYAVEYGPYEDQTGTLRETLTYRTHISAKGQVNLYFYAPAFELRESGQKAYAAYLEKDIGGLEDYWVLSDAVEAYRDKIQRLVGRDISEMNIQDYRAESDEAGARIKFSTKYSWRDLQRD